MKNKITIATRESLLALWQAKYVQHRLEEQYRIRSRRPATDIRRLPGYAPLP